MAREFGAIAVDLGASSGRFAEGWIEDGRLEFRVVEQRSHHASEIGGRLCWDFQALLGLCQSAAQYGESTFKTSTLGIDTWGVDHGFLDADGGLAQPVVCYRDLSHAQQFAALREHRSRLYELTGIQHQPFNTVYQLAARRQENPALTACDWLMLPDLLGFFLSGDRRFEASQASTTQLMGLDDQWCGEAYAIAGWPVPALAPSRAGQVGGAVSGTGRLVSVGSHDTASAVAGFGHLAEDDLFLNVGTWSLAGIVVDKPIATPLADSLGFTNERTVDGRVRLLRNIPGFYVINRLHEELEIPVPVPQWLASAMPFEDTVDLFHEDFFNPASMVETCTGLLKQCPQTHGQWAHLAVQSLARAVAAQPAAVEMVTGRKVSRIRVAGGGSQSETFCQGLANLSGLPVVAGPVEATVLGNLGLQLLASGRVSSLDELASLLDRSYERRTYLPQ